MRIQTDLDSTIFNSDVLKKISIEAYDLGATDISIISEDYVKLSIQGSCHSISKRKIPTPEIEAIIEDLFGSHGVGLIYDACPISFSFAVKLSRLTNLLFRAQASGIETNGRSGISLTCRIIPGEFPTLDGIGLTKTFGTRCEASGSIILLGGATGDGKSTTWRALTRHFLESQQNYRIVTYEEPIELSFSDLPSKLGTVTQSEIGKNIKNYAEALRDALRHNPHIIGLGEVRDRNAAEGMIEAALTGHQVYTTLHGKSVGDMLSRLLQLLETSTRETQACDILRTIEVLVCQRLIKQKDGVVFAVREILYFDKEKRDLLETLPSKKWPKIIDAWVEGEAGSFVQQGLKLFKSGQVMKAELLKLGVRETVNE